MHVDNDDAIIWDIWLSRLYLPALAVADAVGIFQCINNSCNNIDDLAQKLNIQTKGLDALVSFLASMRLVNYSNGRVSLNTTSKTYLLPQSPCYWGEAFIRTYESVEYKKLFTALTDNPVQLSSNGNLMSTMWESGDIDAASAEAFTKIMHSTMMASAIAAINSGKFANISHLLDVGGGSGCFSQLFVENNPKAYATIFELPAVCKILTKNNLNLRINIHPGNFFTDDLPINCDGILLSNILHDWQPDKVFQLLNKSFAALPTGGKIFIHEMLLDENRRTPLTAAAFNLLIYANHGSQQFTKLELYKYLEIAGFKSCTHIKVHSYYSLIIADK